MIGREHYYMNNSEMESDESILTSFIKQFYAGTPFIPRQIMLSAKSDDTELIENWLSTKKEAVSILCVRR